LKAKILGKSYFWILTGTPLVLAAITSFIIINDLNPIVCWTSDCLDNFVEIFGLPLKLLGIELLTTGAALTYYRIELTYSQNENQLTQLTLINHQAFKEDFMSLLKEKKYKYKAYDIPSEWFFSALYPNSKQGCEELASIIEEFIKAPDGDFSLAMDEIEGIVDNPNINPYLISNYSKTIAMVYRLIDLIELDLMVKFNENHLKIFGNDCADALLAALNDILQIVSVINAFEGWRFFDIYERSEFYRYIDELKAIKVMGNQIMSACDSLPSYTIDLSDISHVKVLQSAIDSYVSADVKHDDYAKKFVYDYILSNNIGEDSDEFLLALEHSLRINYD
jgi:hypothetical protein